MPLETIYIKRINQHKIDEDSFNLYNFDTELSECYPLEIDNDDMSITAKNIHGMMKEVFGQDITVGKHPVTEQPFKANEVELEWYEDPSGPELYMKELRKWVLMGHSAGEDRPEQNIMKYLYEDDRENQSAPGGVN